MTKLVEYLVQIHDGLLVALLVHKDAAGVVQHVGNADLQVPKHNAVHAHGFFVAHHGDIFLAGAGVNVPNVVERCVDLLVLGVEVRSLHAEDSFGEFHDVFKIIAAHVHDAKVVHGLGHNERFMAAVLTAHLKCCESRLPRQGVNCQETFGKCAGPPRSIPWQACSGS